MDHPAFGKAIYPNLGICLYPQAFRKYIYIYIYYINVYYCWWRKSCTTWDVHNPVNNGIKYLSTGAGFLPSIVAYPEGLRFFKNLFVGQLDFFYKILIFAYLLHICLACLVCIVQSIFALTAKLKCKNTTEICQTKYFKKAPSVAFLTLSNNATGRGLFLSLVLLTSRGHVQNHARSSILPGDPAKKWPFWDAEWKRDPNS